MSGLRAQGLLPSELTALELFGMHGLQHTRDYVGLCSSLEFYEIDPIYAAYAARTLPAADVVVDDSIQAVNTGKLKQENYTFVVVDNPHSSPYGNGYVEHFDLFPQLLTHLDAGVLVLNFLLAGNPFSTEHAQRRREFYGKVGPSVAEAVTAYRRHLGEAGLQIVGASFTFRVPSHGYLALSCRR